MDEDNSVIIQLQLYGNVILYNIGLLIAPLGANSITIMLTRPVI